MISAIEIGAMGLSVQRLRLSVIANNIANANTTRTPQGGPFRRQVVVVESVGGNSPLGGAEGMGVRVKEVRPDSTPLRSVYDPGNPEAGPDGYVLYPNVQVPVEMIDLVAASRAYEANLAVISSTKQMISRSLDIIRD